MRLSQIKQNDIEKFQTFLMKQGLKESSANRYLTTLKSFFNRIVRNGDLSTSPVSQVRKLKVVRRVVRYFSDDDVQKILNSAPPDFSDKIIILLYTGLRRAEMLNLYVEDIDLKGKRVTVKSRNNWKPKGYKERVIPISDGLVPVFKRLVANRKSGLLFPSSGDENKKLDFSALTRRFKRLLVKVGVKHGSLHTLRHTFATNLILSGVPVGVVSEILGHSSITTTMIYTHVLDEHKAVAVNKLKIFVPSSAKRSGDGIKTEKVERKKIRLRVA